MRSYFNAKERTTNIIIMAMKYILEEMAESSGITEEEKKWLDKATQLVDNFNNSVCDRFGDSYRRKIANTIAINDVKLVSKFGKQAEAISECATDDIYPCVDKLRDIECCNCTKCNFKDCAIYNLCISCDVFGDNQNGCPYKWEMIEID